MFFPPTFAPVFTKGYKKLESGCTTAAQPHHVNGLPVACNDPIIPLPLPHMASGTPQLHKFNHTIAPRRIFTIADMAKQYHHTQHTMPIRCGARLPHCRPHAAMVVESTPMERNKNVVVCVCARSTLKRLGSSRSAPRGKDTPRNHRAVMSH